MQPAVRVVLTLVLLVAAGFLSYDMASYYLYSPWTRDARVRADVVSVAPDVSGYVDDIRVQNDQFVHKGDLLFVVDQERYRIALADAEAGLEARRAQHLMVRAQYERRSQLNPGVTITAEALDNAKDRRTRPMPTTSRLSPHATMPTSTLSELRYARPSMALLRT